MTGELDLVVIGGGAAGITAAREGARRGARTALVQDGPIGGDCTFTGCVPSKTLLAAAARGAPFDDAMAKVRQAVARIAATEDDIALERDGVTVVHGRARLTSPRKIDVDGTRLRSLRLADLPLLRGLDLRRGIDLAHRAADSVRRGDAGYLLLVAHR